jgi:hypothetical protein
VVALEEAVSAMVGTWISGLTNLASLPGFTKYYLHKVGHDTINCMYQALQQTFSKIMKLVWDKNPFSCFADEETRSSNT